MHRNRLTPQKYSLWLGEKWDDQIWKGIKTTLDDYAAKRELSRAAPESAGSLEEKNFYDQGLANTAASSISFGTYCQEVYTDENIKLFCLGLTKGYKLISLSKYTVVNGFQKTMAAVNYTNNRHNCLLRAFQITINRKDSQSQNADSDDVSLEESECVTYVYTDRMSENPFQADNQKHNQICLC
ncbi:hypothetical protein ACH5RR_028354 [Cinchona calisaya]|uniref:Uncharacterized protein n=1 Tax=Cinchona calisaya TaxID=153742 RepID=A0ABD2YTT7_9GENT